MNLKKQLKLIEYLISCPDTFSICNSIMDYEYFDPSLQPTVKFILDFYEEHGGLPKPSVIDAETDVKLKKQKLTKADVNYTTLEIESFCQQMAMQDAILASAELIKKGEFGEIGELIKEAQMVSIQANLGISYFSTVEERLQRLLHGNEILPTKWPTFNQKLFGGPARKELVLFAAGSGGGKSVVLSNLGLDYAELGHNVLYISLELSQDIVAQRFDSMITGFGRKDWEDHIPEIISSVKTFKNSVDVGRLDIVYMKTETKAVEIRAYLKNYQMHYDCTPDIIIVDYLDKLAPNKRVDGNSFDIDKKVSEQLRQIGVDYNAAIITASQLNRSAVGEATQNHSHIAGGISKINEADTFITLYMDEVMKSSNQMNMNFQKTRNSDGVGSSVQMTFDGKTLKIHDGADNLNILKPLSTRDKAKVDRDAISSGKGSDLMEIFGN